jgi:DNA-directed RNA polymerase specialized sigma subunit
MINSTEAFKQYQPLIESFTWKATKRYRYLEHDDIKQQAYLIFCEAIERYDPSRNAQFITFLYHRLRTLNDYCKFNRTVDSQIQLFDSDQEENVIDVTFEQFEAAMGRLEESLELSEDAQDIIDYLISREWETPGINRVPRLYSIKKYYRYWKGWMPKRTEQAWEEIKDWWKSGNHFLQEA